MSEFVISTRYAKALMSISEEKRSFETVVKDVTFVHSSYEELEIPPSLTRTIYNKLKPPRKRKWSINVA